MIVKAALLLFRDHQGEKELLFARPHGKPFFVFPGGKQEIGETIEEALERELKEELAVQVTAVKKLGAVSGQTPDGRDIEMHLYSGELIGNPRPQAEIETIAWMDKQKIADNSAAMTPMTLNHVLPFLASQRIW